jgi:membrane fusion protein, multidrug efflux system
MKRTINEGMEPMCAAPSCRRTAINGIVSCGVFLAAALAFGLCGCAKKADKAESIADIQKREGVPVRVLTLGKGSLVRLERCGGTVEGVSQAELSAGMPGTLTSVVVKVGSRVAEGAVLATIDPDMASPYTMAKAQYDQVAKSRERVQALAKEGGVAQEVVDQVEAGYTVASAQLDAARKIVNIVAPFAGTVIEIMAQTNSKLGPGTAVVKLADLRKARVTLDVNEALINNFAVGQKAFVVVGSDTARGSVEKVALGAKEKGHTFPVDVVFPSAKAALRPGMYVTVNVAVVELAEVLSLPDEVVSYDDQGAYVYVVDNGAARKVRLAIGVRGEGRAAIDSGLAEGQTVVTEGVSLLADGAKVKVVM